MNPRIYLAGKITKNGWREQVVDNVSQHGWGDDMSYNELPDRWPIMPGAVLDRFDYTGPYFTACDHGCAHSKVNRNEGWDIGDATNPHVGVGIGGLHGVSEGMCQGPGRPEQVLSLCLSAIRDSDIVFAWITRPELYGTIYELGFAAASGIPTAIAFSNTDEDEYNPNEYWLATQGAVWTAHRPTAKSALIALHEETLSAEGSPLLRRFNMRMRGRR